MEFETLMHQQELLNQAYYQGIQQNEEHVKTWTQYRDRHKKNIEALETLSSELSENCVVPLGKRAFVKGKLVHTNEILVCIGDGYFVKYSSQQAIALCNRRIKNSEEMLKKLEEERNLLEMRQILPTSSGAFGLGECKDVREYWDDEKLENWRVEHRKREQEYHQKLQELKNQEKVEIVTEDDLFKRLDQLELEEELADEFDRLKEERNKFYANHSDEDEEDDGSDDESHEEIEEIEEKEIIEKEIKEKNETEKEEKKENIPNSEQKFEEAQSNQLVQVPLSKEADNKNTCEVTQGLIEKVNTPVIKDTRINGKFEVSIIKEDEVEKVLSQSNFSLDSCATIHRSREERKYKKYRPTYAYEEPSFSESDTSFEKTKGSGRRVSFAEPHWVEMGSSSKQDNGSEQDSNSDNDISLKSLNEENDDNDVIKIDFKHSQIQTSILQGDDRDIISPRDIYRIFCRPKSILKRPLNNSQNSENTSFFDFNSKRSLRNRHNSNETSSVDFNLQDDNSENMYKSAYNAVVQDIQERKVGEQQIENMEPANKKRPVSRFKLERTNLKK